jgi:hypothetical protein
VGPRKKLETDFKIHKGNRLKGCNNKCLLKSKLQRDKNKCEHSTRVEENQNVEIAVINFIN